MPKKTELQVFNQLQTGNIKAGNGEPLKVFDDLKYLGAWTKSTETDFDVRKANPMERML